MILYWMEERKKERKGIEGDLGGGCEKRVRKMKVFGGESDDEGMNGEDVLKGLWVGYDV